MNTTTRTLASATLAATLLGLGLGLALTGESDGERPGRAVTVRGPASLKATPAPSVDLEPAPATPTTLAPAPVPVDPTAPEPSAARDDHPIDDEPMTMAEDDGHDLDLDLDVRAHAARLLADLAAETDPLAAEVIGEELAPLAAELDPSGRATLVRLARDGDAPRAAALMALGRLEPTPELVELVRDAVLSRPTRAARAAGVDALVLLGERGAPGERVEAAVLALADRTF